MSSLFAKIKCLYFYYLYRLIDNKCYYFHSQVIKKEDILSKFSSRIYVLFTTTILEEATLSNLK